MLHDLPPLLPMHGRCAIENLPATLRGKLVPGVSIALSLPIEFCVLHSILDDSDLSVSNHQSSVAGLLVLFAPCAEEGLRNCWKWLASWIMLHFQCGLLDNRFSTNPFVAFSGPSCTSLLLHGSTPQLSSCIGCGSSGCDAAH